MHAGSEICLQDSWGLARGRRQLSFERLTVVVRANSGPDDSGGGQGGREGVNGIKEGDIIRIGGQRFLRKDRMLINLDVARCQTLLKNHAFFSEPLTLNDSCRTD